MLPLRVSIVSRDPSARLAAARAFDAAPRSWEVDLHDAAPADADVVVLGPDVEAGEGIRFDPGRPEGVLDEVARVAAARSRVVVVTSPGGGTGATSVALHLAAAARGRERCVVDLDLRWGVADRLALDAERARTWEDIGSTTQALRLAALPVPGGFRVLLSPPSAGAPDVPALLERARREFPLVVVDVPNEALLEDALSCADVAVLVLTPTPAGARRAKRVLDAAPEKTWAIVANRLGAGGETTRYALQRILERRVAVELPCAPALRDAEEEGRLLTSPWSRWWRRVRDLERVLEDC